MDKDNIKEDLVFGLVVGLFFGLVAGLLVALVHGLLFGLVAGLLVALVAGLVAGLLVALVFGLSLTFWTELSALINHNPKFSMLSLAGSFILLTIIIGVSWVKIRYIQENDI